MNRRALGALAIVIILLMVIVATAGLDNLPRNVRTAIDGSAAALEGDRQQFAQDRNAIDRALTAEPALFSTRAAGYHSLLDQGATCFANAATSLAALQQIRKRNQRAEADAAEAGLSRFNTARARCGQDARSTRAEVDRWLGYKRELPQRLAAMKTSYDGLHSFDVDAATAQARKAETDWPAKKDDLEARIGEIRTLKAAGEQAWTSTEAHRAAAAANRLDHFDYAAFFAAADRIDSASRQLKQDSDSANQLAAQLYTSWDKLVLDVDSGDRREKVRYVRTKYQDAALANPQVTNEERTEDIEASRVRDAEKQEGMVVARKAAGRYDSEAEKTVQPPAIAYVAPPGQANHYGSWNNGVWTWLPQYLILRELLNASRGPITYGDYHGWDSARRRGEVYYGNGGYGWWHSRRTAPTTSGGWGGALNRARDWASSRSGGVTAPSSSGTGGGFYKERPKTYGGSGGYSGSQYRSQGSYSGSKYQSRGGYGSFGSRSYSRGGGFSGGGRSFGRGGRR